MKKDKDNSSVKQIKKITYYGIMTNLSMAALKLIVGYLGASQAVIADAIHSLSDMFTDFALIFGVKFWSAPPDQNHPYGHRRIEALVTVTIGLALVSVAVGLGYKAIATIRDVHITQVGWVAIWGPLLSIIFKEVLYRITVRVGVRVKSTAVIANAWHHRSDALSSIPALVAVAASAINPDWAFIDHIGALIISAFILKVSWDILSPSLSELTDRGASIREQKAIRKLASSVTGVKEVHAIRTRKFSSSLHVDLHILVEPEISVRSGHEISEKVKKVLIDQGPEVLDVVVHLEPYD